MKKLTNLLLKFWYYEPFWKWYRRILIALVFIGWILMAIGKINWVKWK